MKVLRINLHWLPFTTWEVTTKRPPKYIKNCCWKAESTKLSTYTLLYATTKWNITMSVYRSCQGMKPLIQKVYSQQISRPVTITKCTQGRMQSKSSDRSSKSSRVGIFSRKVTFWDTTSLFSEVGRMLCKFFLPWLSCSLKLDWIWSFIAWRMRTLKRRSTWLRTSIQQIQGSISSKLLLCSSMVKRRIPENTWNQRNSFSKL